MLEEMREAAAAARLKAEADLIIDADSDDWRRAVGRGDDAETVGERGVLDGNMKFFRLVIQFVPPLGASIILLEVLPLRLVTARRSRPPRSKRTNALRG